MIAMTDLVLKDAAAGDTGTIRSVLLRTWLDTYSPFVPEADLRRYFETAYSAAAVCERLARPGVRCTLAWRGDICCGVMITTLEAEKSRLAVSSLYVVPEEQGKGVGRLLLERAEEEARGARCAMLRLGVMERNARAVEWYRRAGFLIETTEPFIMGETSVPHLLCSRPVSYPAHGEPRT
ncbi:MAG: GNAT family N-acetyltransferase [Planctomycetaceae bacterium]|nr:MAG: GNAT family N-acetyltransferase [Planctomycetaceae bacterium]